MLGHLDGSPRGGFKSAKSKVLKLVGVADYRLHDNRRAYCASILLAGAPEVDIMKKVGHKDPAMTRRYTYATSTRQEPL